MGQEVAHDRVVNVRLGRQQNLGRRRAGDASFGQREHQIPVVTALVGQLLAVQQLAALNGSDCPPIAAPLVSGRRGHHQAAPRGLTDPSEQVSRINREHWRPTGVG
jgi:hypothetical protein